MKHISTSRKLLIGLLLCSSLAIVARVPLNDNRSIWQHIFAGKKTTAKETVTGKATDPELEKAWKELEKIAAGFSSDTLTVSGTLSLYDNLNDDGVKETQGFLWQRAGVNQRLRLDSFERFELENSQLLVDHKEKEIVITRNSFLDSATAAMKMLDPEKIKELLKQDGTAATFEKEDGFELLRITPGNHDAVNEYVFVYDAATYDLKKFRVSYTSMPYQDFQENDETNDLTDAGNVEKQQDTVAADEEPEIEMNITEYIVEYKFRHKDKKLSFNFNDNELFRQTGETIVFKGRAAGYKKTDY